MALLGVFSELIKATSGPGKLPPGSINEVLEILNKYLSAAALKTPADSILPNMTKSIEEELKEWGQASEHERWEAYSTFIDKYIPADNQSAAISIWLSHGNPLSISDLIKTLVNNPVNADTPLLLWYNSNKNIENAKKIISPLIESLKSAEQTLSADTQRFKDLVGIALELKNKELLMLILSKFYFPALKTQTFRQFCDEIINNFPENNENQDLYLLIEETAASRIHHKLDVGKIDNHDMALILAAKTAKKIEAEQSYINTIFVINKDEVEQLVGVVKFLMANNTSDIVKFQIIYYNGFHAIYGEFEINKTQDPPIVKYLHCESVAPSSPEFIGFNTIITDQFKVEISPLVEQIEIYNTSTPIQKGLGCTYFALDGASMLATPEDRSYTQNVMRYMRDHKDAKKENIGEKITQISAPLPPRLLRGSHYTDNLTPLLDPSKSEANQLVNKKGTTALKSIREYLNIETGKTLNTRVMHKMKTYHYKVKEFIQGKKLSPFETSKLEAPYGIVGLKSFCQKQVTCTKDPITANYDHKASSSVNEKTNHNNVSEGVKTKLNK